MIVCPCCQTHIPFSLAVDKFWAQVDKHGPIPERDPTLGNCWVWVGRTDSKDKQYGVLSIEGNAFKAHRYSYLLAYGEIPESMLVRHKCDNPPCVNPAHLELGTNDDNMQDRKARGRYAIGSTHARTRLTEIQVLNIRADYVTGEYTYALLGKKYNVSKECIADIIRRRVWKHI